MRRQRATGAVKGRRQTELPKRHKGKRRNRFHQTEIAAREADTWAAVAENALTYSRLAPFARMVLVNGSPGIMGIRDGQPFALLAFAIRGGKVAEIDVIANRKRLRELDLAALGD